MDRVHLTESGVADTEIRNAGNGSLPAWTERRFLEQQSAISQAAMARVLRELKATVETATGVRSRARQHPWVLAGSAIAAGFIAGAALHRAAPIGRSPHQAVGSAARGDADVPSTAADVPSWLSTVGTALSLAVITVLQGVVTSALAALLSRGAVRGAASSATAESSRVDVEQHDG